MLIALLPAIFALYWFFGLGVIFNLLASCVCALVLDLGLCLLRHGHLPRDGRALTLAVLLGMSLPTVAPWWISVAGGVLVILAKHYLTRLNPVMATYLCLLLLFPTVMGTWLMPQSLSAINLTYHDFVVAFLRGELPVALNQDSVTGATPLQTLNVLSTLKQPVHNSLETPIFGQLGGAGWEWVSLAYLCGGLWLVQRDSIECSVPAGVLTGLGLMALGAYSINSMTFAPPLLHCFTGSTMACAFFVAADPQTAPDTSARRLLYGLLIGIGMYLLRISGFDADGSAYAVLLANLLVPHKSYLTNRVKTSHRHN